MSARPCFLRLGDEYLDDARPFPSIAAAVADYAATARELRRYGQRIDATLHYAATRDELAEYPDYVLELGARGNVRKVPA